MRTGRRSAALLAVFAVALFVSACDESEQGRILRYEKGTYLGPADTQLSSEARTDLRARTRMQKGN